GTARYAYSPEKCPSDPAVIDFSNRHPCRSRALLAFRGHSPNEISGLAKQLYDVALTDGRSVTAVHADLLAAALECRGAAMD
ncbi:hypothetical protein, partial [Agilicoccus flavus]|uniref:hypothetical protein n=1 Tax=Agilicoccus flavus TaxID=2775968 RepID=UPI001CF65574